LKAEHVSSRKKHKSRPSKHKKKKNSKPQEFYEYDSGAGRYAVTLALGIFPSRREQPRRAGKLRIHTHLPVGKGR